MAKTEKKVKNQSQFRFIVKRLYQDKVAMVGFVIFAIVIFIAVFADYLAPYDYAQVNMKEANMLPCAAHPFGTDNVGRDLLSRVIVGARYTLFLGICSQFLALVLGIILGSVAGYYGGWIDNLIMRFTDIWQSIPGTLLAIIISSALGTGWMNTVLALGIGRVAGIARLLRGQFLTIREREFIEAERAIKCPNFLLVVKHMLPNAMAPLIVETAMGIAIIIMSAAGLSYIGLGVQPPTPEWGAMITAARENLRYYPHQMFFPGLAIAITIIALNMFGDGLRDAMDPKLKR